MAFKMAPKTPLMMALKGNQPNLPEGLRTAIENTPSKMMDSPAKQTSEAKAELETDYYNIRPKDARTHADSAAVESRFISGGDRKVGALMGKVASNNHYMPGEFKEISTVNTPNSQEAKDTKDMAREVAAELGKNHMDAYKSAPTKNMNKGYGPTAVAKNMNKGYGSPALQTSNTSRGTIGGKPIKDMQSAADVPRTTSFGGNDYHLGFQSPSGQHYYNEGYSFKDGKQGKVERPGDEGIYHVSRPNEKPIPSLKSKKAKITTAKTGATKLATVNTEKPKVSKTKRETRRGKRADKLEKRVNKLRGDSPVKQTSKAQRKRDHDARMQERSDNPRVAAHNDKLGHESPRKTTMTTSLEAGPNPSHPHSTQGNMVYSMMPVTRGKMKRPNTASRRDNTSI